ncbi:nitrate reductase [Phanerochaete sordida]|uniref:Nitrate reductase n=1 Tax=Phanerochaete sordida TaxID=48140 RepID=A0A9P3FZI4_9APHY|nr:nitrate reductase [Phanerochaete sordida]
MTRSSSVESRLSGSDVDRAHSGGTNTPDSSVQSSPILPSKIPYSLPSPFFPPSLEAEDSNRQCPPLPPDFPAVPLNETPRVTAAADAQTPDNWLPRDPKLIRLTGKHPFNTEAYLTPLFDAGFLTPAHLHVVRNHGAVPKIAPGTAYADWTVRVHGLVQQEAEFSLRELAARFPVVTLPVTICCAGNRRKEQNVVRKSLGFNWGAGGVSTALWTGVYLADVLEYARPLRPRAKHVIFEGADDLPKGPYGTSQKLSWAADREKGMLIAWAMNGLALEPDHGFPVRLVVPGQIGGRMVKWLTRIEVAEAESSHYLHYWDNKVLPMQYTPEQARDTPALWYDPRYIITELNVNSAVARPAHAEVLDVPAAALADATQTYTVRGYAYAGGGRRINRVELSLDGGRTWALADIEYPEDRFRGAALAHAVYGTLDLTTRDTCFCWCFWALELPLGALAGADVLALRATDEGMHTQPRDMYLNATSMLNNWWFRVAVRRVRTAEGVRLTFEHPAVVGQEVEGWMERMKAEGRDILNPVFSDVPEEQARVPLQSAEKTEVVMTKPSVERKMAVEELKAQDKQKPWFVVHGEVYDGTAYLQDHPGGADSILLVAGEDATEDFMAIHSVDAKQKLAKYHIGTLSGSLSEPAPSTASSDDPTAPFLDPKVWKSVKLTNIERVNHDSLIYRFDLPHAEQPLGLPVGQHVFVRLRRKDTGEMVQRAYTPVSMQDVKGSIDFLIKLYLPTDEYPSGGKMTVGFHQLEVGDSLELKGPLGSFIWKGRGTALWKGVQHKVSEIGLVCGGSGITPILQVLRSILHDEEDTETRLWLLSANKTEHDILCRAELDALCAAHGASGRFRVHYTLSAGAPPAWTYSTGRVSESMLRAHLPAPGAGRLVLACGPPAMIDGALKAGLAQCGWDVPTQLVVF